MIKLYTGEIFNSVEQLLSHYGLRRRQKRFLEIYEECNSYSAAIFQLSKEAKKKHLVWQGGNIWLCDCGGTLNAPRGTHREKCNDCTRARQVNNVGHLIQYTVAERNAWRNYRDSKPDPLLSSSEFFKLIGRQPDDSYRYFKKGGWRCKK